MKLNNVCVLVTRPRPQGEALCARLSALGAIPVYLPTMDIVPPFDTALFKQQMLTLFRYDWVIFVSAQAVHQSAPFILADFQPANIAAIGASTAQALQEANLPMSVYPMDEWSSEGLLKLPEFQALSGKRIALVRGEGGRTLLADALTVRGAAITHFIAYHRRLPTDTSGLNKCIDLLHAQKIDIIICTSGESLHNLGVLFGKENHALLTQVPLLVVSERIAALAKEAHYKTVFLAENASHDAIIKGIHLCKMTKQTHKNQ